MKKGGAIYIMKNFKNTVLYTGVTNDLIRSVLEHKSRVDTNSFTFKYNFTKLVYFESFHSIDEGIAIEKHIRGGSRKKKDVFINSINPDFNDL